MLNQQLSVQYISTVEVFCFAISAFLISIGCEWILNKLRVSANTVLFASVILPYVLLLSLLMISTYYFDLGENFSRIQWHETTSFENILAQLQNWYKINSTKSVHIEIFLMTVANFMVPVFLFQMGIALITYTFANRT